MSLASIACMGISASAHAQERSCTLSPGTTERSVQVGNFERTYLVHVGPDAVSGRAPLVFLWHGFGQTAESIARVIQPERDWPEAIVVTPRGLKRRFRSRGQRRAEGWQVRAGEQGDRDLLFFDAMRADLLATGCVDAERVFSTGLSNGGFFSNLLGCMRGDVLAAIAPVAGGAHLEKRCVGTVPVLITHGRSDDVVPFRAAQRVVDAWAEQNACTVPPELESGRCTPLLDCSTIVGVCVHSGGHFWPGMATSAVVGFFQGIHAASPPADSGD